MIHQCITTLLSVLLPFASEMNFPFFSPVCTRSAEIENCPFFVGSQSQENIKSAIFRSLVHVQEDDKNQTNMWVRDSDVGSTTIYYSNHYRILPASERGRQKLKFAIFRYHKNAVDALFDTCPVTRRGALGQVSIQRPSRCRVGLMCALKSFEALLTPRWRVIVKAIFSVWAL